jgi:hypothetical protein
MVVRAMFSNLKTDGIDDSRHSFLGFLYALWILGHGQYSVYDISKWMIWIWSVEITASWWEILISYRFGLDSTGLELARNFHAFWGPVLFVRPYFSFYIGLPDVRRSPMPVFQQRFC